MGARRVAQGQPVGSRQFSDDSAAKRRDANLHAMNARLRKFWTQEEFFVWAASRESRYEFDGLQPVAMTGGTLGHDILWMPEIGIEIPVPEFYEDIDFQDQAAADS